MEILTNGVFLAIMAHGLIGISLVWDKILLRQPETRSLVNYVFWLGAISIFGLLLIPFGFRMPEAKMAGLALAAGAIQLAATYFYYAALNRGEASQTLAIMGGFAPLATALIGMGLLTAPFGHEDVLGFALMVIGGFVMFASEKFNWRRVLPAVLLASVLFGLSNVLQKVVFNSTGFVSGYVFFTLGTFLGAMFLLVRPSWREQIFETSEKASPRSRFWYFVNRFISGVGSFLVFLAISRTSPAIVDAISGVRYAIIFLGALSITHLKPDWLCEDCRRAVLTGKSVATLLVVAGLVLIGLGGGGGAGGPAFWLAAQWDSSATPAATRQAPSHLTRVTRSLRMYFASRVSSR